MALGLVLGGLGAAACGGRVSSDGEGTGSVAGSGATPGGVGGGGAPLGGTGGIAGAGGGSSGAAGGTGAGAGLGGRPSGGGTSMGGRGTGGSATGGIRDLNVPECMLSVPETTTSLAGDTFWDHPWPSDLRRDAAGKLELTGFPNPNGSSLLSAWLSALDGVLDGYSPAAAGYLRFSDSVDAWSLPATPSATLLATSSVQLIDVDPSSPALGRRHPVEVAFHGVGDGYYGENTLAFQPALGQPLRPGTRYALVVTNAVTWFSRPISACAELRQVLGLEPAAGRTAALAAGWSDAVRHIVVEGQIPLDSIVHLTVFTTDRPTATTERLREYLVSEYPAPAVESLTLAEQTSTLDVYEGTYGPSPDFQAGVPPFLFDGGAIEWTADGSPLVARALTLRFTLAVPNAARCAGRGAGVPVAIYAHGTGGDYRSALVDGTADRLAAACVATFSIDQIFHGDRPGGPCAARRWVEPCNPLPESMAVFNTLNPRSMRHSDPQAAMDLVQQARLVTRSALAVPANVSATGARIAFAPDRVLLRAHSQGSVNGVLALAVDDGFAGAALSGSAAMATLSLLGRTEPADLAESLATELYGAGSPNVVDLDHPALALLQTGLDIGDPLHFARLVVAEPLPGFSPKSVLLVEGVGPGGVSDGYVSSHAIEVLGVALGLPPLAPLVAPIAELDAAGLAPITVPSGGLTGNLVHGQATGALAQFAPPAGLDAHFVAFDVPAAANLIEGFLGTLATSGVARIESF